MKYTSCIDFLYWTLLPITLFCSCAEDNKDYETVISAIPETLIFETFDGKETKELTILSTDYIKATPDNLWCKVGDASNPEPGKYIFQVCCEANGSASERKTTIRVRHGSQELLSVPVTQVGETLDTKFYSFWENIGWNYGNQMEAFSDGAANETCWGNPKAGQATFDGVKRAGFKTVRIPITWMGHIGGAPNYKIDDIWMNRVAELVDYCERAGLNAIINIHHDGSDSNYWLNIKEAAVSADRESQITKELVAIWTQIANQFKDKGEWLMFETMNEIHDGGWGWGDNTKDGGKQYAVLNRWNQACIDAIRSTGGENATRWIGVPGYCTNIDLTVKYLIVPTDAANRVAVAVHNYDPYKFTLECTQSSYNQGDIDNIKKQFESLKKAYMDKGIPCYLGEFGCVQRPTNEGEKLRLNYLREFSAAAKKYGLPIILWDNNADNYGSGGKECNAFINHADGSYKSSKG